MATNPDLEMAISIVNRDSRRYRLLRDAIQKHLDRFGYDNHEELVEALVACGEFKGARKDV